MPGGARMMVGMEWLGIGLALAFSLLGLVCILVTAIGLPGTWLMIALAVGLELLEGALGVAHDSTKVWWTIGICAAFALVGEVVETAAGAAGTRAGGGTRRGMVGAILGGIVGGLFLTPIVPIPLVGTLIGAMIGTFAGALVAELSAEQALGHGASMRAATGATIGRLVGTMGKTLVAAFAWVVLTLLFLID
jgi:hypothetical protein